MSQVRINLAKLLGVEPRGAFAYLKVELGKKVEKGQLIAFKKKLFTKIEVKAPCSGRLVKYEEDSGDLVLEKIATAPPKASEDKEAMATEGEKAKRIKRKVILKGEFSFGRNKGEIFYQENFALPNFDKSLKGKILVIRNEVGPILLFKAATLGIKGIICGRLDDKLKNKFLKKKKTFSGIGLLSCDFKENKEALAKLGQGERVLLKGGEKALYKIDAT